MNKKYSFTVAKRRAFTMAEILLSLTIIGVVAAITLPSLTGNINERTWDTQKKALYSRISQAVSLLPSMNGYGQYYGTWTGSNANVTQDTAAEAFITDGLSKVLKINNICSIPMGVTGDAARAELAKCGVPSKVTNMKNSKIDLPTNLHEFIPTLTTSHAGASNPQKNINTNAAAFETINGESVVVYYNPYCTLNGVKDSRGLMYVSSQVCVNFVYDLNGLKGPNAVGKDIDTITVFYPYNSVVVAPVTINDYTRATYNNSVSFCRGKGGRIPNKEELGAIYYNDRFLGLNDKSAPYVFHFWSNDVNSEAKVFGVAFSTGAGGYDFTKSEGLNVRCVKKR